MAADTIDAHAAKGYCMGEEIVACEEAGIAVTVSNRIHLVRGQKGSKPGTCFKLEAQTHIGENVSDTPGNHQNGDEVTSL